MIENIIIMGPVYPWASSSSLDTAQMLLETCIGWPYTPLFILFYIFCFLASSTLEKCGSVPVNSTLLFIDHLLCHL